MIKRWYFFFFFTLFFLIAAGQALAACNTGDTCTSLSICQAQGGSIDGGFTCTGGVCCIFPAGTDTPTPTPTPQCPANYACISQGTCLANYPAGAAGGPCNGGICCNFNYPTNTPAVTQNPLNSPTPTSSGPTATPTPPNQYNTCVSNVCSTQTCASPPCTSDCSACPGPIATNTPTPTLPAGGQTCAGFGGSCQAAPCSTGQTQYYNLSDCSSKYCCVGGGGGGCAAGQTNPYSVCNPSHACQTFNACGVSNCTTNADCGPTATPTWTPTPIPTIPIILTPLPTGGMYWNWTKQGCPFGSCSYTITVHNNTGNTFVVSNKSANTKTDTDPSSGNRGISYTATVNMYINNASYAYGSRIGTSIGPTCNLTCTTNTGCNNSSDSCTVCNGGTCKAQLTAPTLSYNQIPNGGCQWNWTDQCTGYSNCSYSLTYTRTNTPAGGGCNTSTGGTVSGLTSLTYTAPTTECLGATYRGTVKVSATNATTKTSNIVYCTTANPTDTPTNTPTPTLPFYSVCQAGANGGANTCASVQLSVTPQFTCSANADCNPTNTPTPTGTITPTNTPTPTIDCGGGNTNLTCTTDTNCIGNGTCTSCGPGGICVTPTPTPTPTNNPACGQACSQPSDCSNAGNCSACINGTCQAPPPECTTQSTCTSGADCTANGASCNDCVNNQCEPQYCGGAATNQACSTQSDCSSDGTCSVCAGGTCHNPTDNICGLSCSASSDYPNQCGNGGSNGCNFCDPSTNKCVPPPAPWFQGVGGDMRIDSQFIDDLPSNKVASLPGSGNTPGIVFSGSTDPDFGQLNNNNAASTLGWQAGNFSYPEAFNSTISPLPLSYEKLLSDANGQARDLTTYCTGGLTDCTLNNLPNGVFIADTTGLPGQEVKLEGYTFTGNKNFVILVKGNLKIAGRILVDPGSTANIAASGNITIDAGLGGNGESGGTVASCNWQQAGHPGCDLEGYLAADKQFIVEHNNALTCPQADVRLKVAGMIVANATRSLGSGIKPFDNQRTLCDNNISTPTVVINERPDMILNAPLFLKTNNAIWQEVAP